MSEQLEDQPSKVFLDALGKLCYYRIDSNMPDPEWVPVYLVGVDSGCGRIEVEVLPKRDTPYGSVWYQENKPKFNFFPGIIKNPQPSPIKVTDLSRIHL